jgi:hypothetical protein
MQRNTEEFRELSKRFAAHVPARMEEFDILNIPGEYWQHIYILDIEAPGRMRVRHTGTGINSRLKRDCKGEYMDNIIHGPRSADVLVGFNHCKNENQRMIMSQLVTMQDGPSLFVRCCVIPLMSATDEVQNLVGLLKFSNLGQTELMRSQSEAFHIFKF